MECLSAGAARRACAPKTGTALSPTTPPAGPASMEGGTGCSFGGGTPLDLAPLGFLLPLALLAVVRRRR
jgi:hypothetical protein